ncbi:MAG: type II toxin-antitoxin system prevent-host-death family antitoxin [Xanthomonadaceae bacterium]|nr:type II toxin-antitoxin system prevent-host-death family antitoxin [Xanthomonadaceae bacterium]
MQISTRELKASLSAVLRRVRAGEEISVTSHGKVVAHLSPPPPEEAQVKAVDRLRRQAWAVVPDRPPRKLGLANPVEWRGTGASFTDLLLEDRD